MSYSGALVIFVKTPHLSPIKTRLSHSIGEDLTLQFYKQSLLATASVVKLVKESMPGLVVYWAVAESDGLSSAIWKDFPTLWQGTGGLGDRLSSIYDQVLSKHNFACFIGADSPHLTSENLKQGIFTTFKNFEKRFVIGETEDGGFYFFGGSLPVSKNIWNKVEYSKETTAKELINHFSEIALFEQLETNFDIDNIHDLVALSETNTTQRDLTKEQIDLINWAKKQSLCKKTS